MTLKKDDTPLGERSGIQLGQNLWTRAKEIIPGGNMLLSKQPDRFLPKYWPTYFSKAKGCNVWDLSGTKFIDMSLMGVGTNLLGYGHPEVDEAVYRAISQGNMSTLNCPEEVQLAERLIEIHGWADMVRLARTGGEAVAIAVRIARASTGRENIAFCGYHGWHDWYLATNLTDAQGLDNHLLPGLEPSGVPQSLAGTVYPFEHGNLDSLQNVLRAAAPAAIIMEVARSKEPQQDYLEGVRELATRHGSVLIFDECTSGFRETYGGLHTQIGVEPDMAVFGKALGNGYAITAVLGRRSVMKVAEKTFISSTFWTERIGPTAALETLAVMKREESWKSIIAKGQEITNGWKTLSKQYELPIKISGLTAIPSFEIVSDNSAIYKTIITLEMLKSNFLASNLLYVSLAHTSDIIKDYLSLLDPVFSLIKDLESGRPIESIIDTPIAKTGFKRLV